MEEPHAVVARPHGNSKTGLPFQPTQKSVLKEIKKAVEGGASSGDVYHQGPIQRSSYVFQPIRSMGTLT